MMIEDDGRIAGFACAPFGQEISPVRPSLPIKDERLRGN